MLRCAGGWRAGECCTRRGKQKTAGNGERRCDVFHVILPVWTMVTADECAIPAGAKAGCTVPNKTVISASRDCPIDADVDRRYGMSNAGQDGRASVERRFLRTNINFESVDLTFSADETDHRHCRLLCACRERPRRRRAAERSQQFPPSDGNCHTPLPCEVRKGNDITPRACSLHARRAGCEAPLG